jgi:hypothetical protein
MNEQDASRILSAKLEEAEKAITAMVKNNSDEEITMLLERYLRMSESSSRWFRGRKLMGLLASYSLLRGMRLAGRM